MADSLLTTICLRELCPGFQPRNRFPPPLPKLLITISHNQLIRFMAGVTITLLIKRLIANYRGRVVEGKAIWLIRVASRHRLGTLIQLDLLIRFLVHPIPGRHGQWRRDPAPGWFGHGRPFASAFDSSYTWRVTSSRMFLEPDQYCRE